MGGRKKGQEFSRSFGGSIKTTQSSENVLTSHFAKTIECGYSLFRQGCQNKRELRYVDTKHYFGSVGQRENMF